MSSSLNSSPMDSYGLDHESTPGQVNSAPDASTPAPASEAAEARPPGDGIEQASDAATGIQSAAVIAWKKMLRIEFDQWLESVQEIPASGGAAESESEDVDLYSFFEQLATLTTEHRKANRRVAEAMSQWGDALTQVGGDLHLLRERMVSLASANAKPDSLPRHHYLALVELLDRMYRLAAAFASPPKPSWWDDDARMRQAWETQRQAFDILLSHLEALLKQAGITRIEVLNKSFDPALMVAVAAEPDPHRPHQTVIEEIVAGYRLHDDLLRLAQVKVTLNPSNP
ncbi:MAG: nucleotide exchange factor GrpE [Candidatus Omnitrophica bacterium]|nr:nucleotide exchange factor GrpE [Candidatus Omnitrophota bacterium]